MIRIVGVALLSLVLAASGMGLAINRYLYDFHLSRLTSSALPEEIVLVTLDDNSFDVLADEGLNWPFPRQVHGRLIDHLKGQGAKAVFLDIIFDLPSGYGEEDDFLFASYLEELPVILAAEYGPESMIPPLPFFFDAGALVGNVYTPLDSDGFIRVMNGALRLPETFLEAMRYYCGGFSLTLDQQQTDSFANDMATAENVIQNLFSDNARPPGYINFSGPAGTIPSLSYYEVLNPDLLNLNPDFFRDKIVFVGKTITASITPGRQADVFLAPFDRSFMAGVEIRAQALASQLSGKTRYLISPLFFLGLFLLWTFLASFLMERIKGPAKSGVLLIGIVAMAEGGFILAFQRLLVVPIAPFFLFPLLNYGLQLGRRYIKERDARLNVQNQLFHYLPERVARHVMKSPLQLAMPEDRKTITLLFADIAGFTTLSEKEPPDVVIPLLQEHLGDMTKAIFNQEGTLDKYLGDGIMAFWGAPEEQENHADLALQAAVDMLSSLDQANAGRRQRNLPELSLRIGLHTGEAIVGNIGSSRFIDYTAIGDTVNTASRIEGSGKYLGTRLTITDACVKALVGGRPDSLFQVARVGVKGRDKPITLYTMAAEGERDCFKRLLKVMAAMDSNDLAYAETILKEIVETHPDFGPAQFHLKYLQEQGVPQTDQDGFSFWKLEGK